MITVVKENAPNHLVTIGWSKSAAAIHLANKVDFVLSFYNAIEDLEKKLKNLGEITKTYRNSRI
jgi:precorrin-3B methylase